MKNKSEKIGNEYWNQKIDKKKLALRFLSKSWIAVGGIFLGIILGIVIYFVYHNIADEVKYEAYAQFYLDFAPDETGETYQYYNGYTWNELMTTSLIADNTLKHLEGTGIDLSVLEKDTYAEIKSDIRVLRVTISDGDPQVCSEILSATKASMEELGETAKEFLQISTIKSVEPYRVYADDRLKQAILLGAIVGFIISLLVLWFMSILNDKVYVPSDLYDLGVPLLGIELKNTDEEVAKKISSMYSGVLEYIIKRENISTDSMDEISRVGINELLKNNTEDESKPYILDVPYGEISVSMLREVLTNLSIQDRKPLGIIITLADNKFYKMYI